MSQSVISPAISTVSEDMLVNLSLTQSFRFCAQLAGLEDKQAAAIVGVDKATWSKILSGNAAFPQQKYEYFMRKCGNAAPLQVLARSCGYTLRPLESEFQRQLRIANEEIEQLKKENQMLERIALKSRT